MTILADAITSIAADPTQALVGAGGLAAIATAIGGVVVGALRWRTARASVDAEAERTKRHDAKNATQIKVSEAEHDATVAGPLMSLVTEQGKRIDALHAEIATRDDECSRKLAQAQADCAEHIEASIAPFRSALAIIAGEVRDRAREEGREDTAVVRLDEIARSDTPLPRPMPERGEE